MAKWLKKLLGLTALAGAAAGILFYFKKRECGDAEDGEDVFEDEQITFFAPTDWSIRGSFNYLNRIWYRMGHDSIKSFSQIKPEVWREMLSMYIVKDKYLQLLEDVR